MKPEGACKPSLVYVFTMSFIAKMTTLCLNVCLLYDSMRVSAKMTLSSIFLKTGLG